MITFKQFLKGLAEAEDNAMTGDNIDGEQGASTSPTDIPEIDIGDLWEEVKDTATSYLPDTEYFVKPNADKDGDYDVTYTEGGKRVLYATVPYGELKSAFSPVYPNQTPDVEGYTKWRSLDRIDAAQYKGDPQDVIIGALKVRINDGDFVTRTTSGEQFVYAIESERFFKQAFKKL